MPHQLRRRRLHHYSEIETAASQSGSSRLPHSNVNATAFIPKDALSKCPDLDGGIIPGAFVVEVGVGLNEI